MKKNLLLLFSILLFILTTALIALVLMVLDGPFDLGQKLLIVFVALCGYTGSGLYYWAYKKFDKHHW